jgi:hypothetical protein
MESRACNGMINISPGQGQFDPWRRARGRHHPQRMIANEDAMGCHHTQEEPDDGGGQRGRAAANTCDAGGRQLPEGGDEDRLDGVQPA